MPERAVGDTAGVTGGAATKAMNATTKPLKDNKWQLWAAAAAVLLGAADTYVVIIALPSIVQTGSGGIGLGLQELQRATPIISGYLLGYVALLPLLGRLSDLHGRKPVFEACLITFALGSLLTATAPDEAALVVGRAIQGVGGGGMVPVTLALIADMWPPEERGVPLGVIGAVQELGSVLGPLYGAAIVAASTWRVIFWLNLPLTGLLAVAFILGAKRGAGPSGRERGFQPKPDDPARPDLPAPAKGPTREGRPDVVGTLLAVVGFTALTVALWNPPSLANSVTWGGYFLPKVSGPTWSIFTTEIAFASYTILFLFLVWEAFHPASIRPLFPVRRLRAVFSNVDVLGALLLGGVLTCIVILFSTQNPEKQVVASSWVFLVPLGVVLTVALYFQERRCAFPLIDGRVFTRRPAWGSLLVNLFVGGSLIAVTAGVPLFARFSGSNSQFQASLVLTRFLLAVPIGAILGGFICRRWSNAVTSALGMLVAAVTFIPMVSWGQDALHTPIRIAGASLGVNFSDIELVLCGLGFGLAIAPINAAVLGAVDTARHGLAISFTVVARQVGMIVGLSALVALALRRFYETQNRLPMAKLCPNLNHCSAYTTQTTHALISEIHVVFAGAGIAALIASALSLATLRAEHT